MLLHDILSVSFIAISFILTMNFWLILGFIIVNIFEDFDTEEVQYQDVLIMSASWPLTILMFVAKQLHIKGRKG